MRPTKEQNSKKIKDLTKDLMCDIYKDYCSLGLGGETEKILEEAEKLFDKNGKIYKNKTKYDLEYIFKITQKEFNELFKNLLEEKIKTNIDCLQRAVKQAEKDDELKEEFERLKKLNKKRKTSLKKKSHLFSIISALISWLDMIFSVSLIVLISKVGHWGESLIDSAIWSFLFLVLIALFKFGLERKFLIPKVKSWGWKLYLKANKTFKYNLAVMLAISEAVSEAIKRKETPRQTVEICEKGVRKLIL